MKFDRTLKALRRFSVLGLPDKLELLRLWAGLNLAHLRLELFPHRWNLRWLKDLVPPPDSSGGAQEGKADRIAALLALAGQVSFRDASCLRRSLVLRDRLRSIGLPAVLVYGVRRGAGDGVEAHAWVSVRGKVLDTYGSAGYFRPLETQNRSPKKGAAG